MTMLFCVQQQYEVRMCVRKQKPYVCAQSISKNTKLDFELTKDFGDVNFQIHQTAVNMLNQPTKVTETTAYAN